MEAYVAKYVDHRELHVAIYPSKQKVALVPKDGYTSQANAPSYYGLLVYYLATQAYSYKTIVNSHCSVVCCSDCVHHDDGRSQVNMRHPDLELMLQRLEEFEVSDGDPWPP